MKLKDITTGRNVGQPPLGTMDAHRCGRRAGGSVSMGNDIIGLAVQCPDGRYFGSIRAPGPVYDHVLEFLKRNHGRKLREVMDVEIDISDVIQ